MRVLLFAAILSLTFCYYPCRNIEDLTSKDLSDLEALLSNETTEETTKTAAEHDLLQTTTHLQESSEGEKDGSNEGKEETEVTRETCGNPPFVEHAKIEGIGSSKYDLGTRLSYYCEFGSSADGANHFSRCIAPTDGGNPTWTDPQLVCITRSCGDPGFVPHARRIGSRFTFPNQVSFECEDGYELKGSNIRYCLVSGRWSGSLPTCENIYCTEPIDPENGQVFYTSLEYGSELRYECEKGFLLKQLQTRKCTENGTWSGNEPSCVDAQCDMPVAPDHGNVELVGGRPRIGSIAIYTCDRNRRLIGSSTSKCLEIGEWTFQTPKCVEPCMVPDIQHGEIGKYETKRRYKSFIKLSVGTGLENREELYIRCDSKHEPMGRDKAEEKVICENGEWKETPRCEPASCRSQPPSMQNGRLATINREHGRYVVYYCNEHFKKTKYGNITCNFGTWEGVTPICSDKRCYLDRLQFPGLVIGRKNVFRTRETFKPSCEKGYDVTKPENKLVCDDGTWKGHFPPCKAASCVNPPPSVNDGRITHYTGLHSSFVTYECNEGFFMHSPSSAVQCLFGEWKGSPPICKGGSCYFNNLKYKKGMTAPSKDPILSGESVEVRCAAGYSALNIIPFCSKGEWTEFGTSPCQQNSCEVYKVDNGAFTKQVIKQRWSWTHFVNDLHFERVRVGSVARPGDGLFITCDYGFTFHGKNAKHGQVMCEEGKWTPTPVCLRLGQVYQERKQTPVTVTSTTVTINPTTTPLPTVPSRNHLSANSDHLPDSLVSAKTNQDDVNDCYCLYEGSEDLVAYSDDQRLEAGSKVKLYARVKFHCRHFGYQRFMGPTELVCSLCRPWHSSAYPECQQPERGDTIINVVNSHFKLLPGGVVAMDPGSDAQFNCVGNGVVGRPEWRTPPVTHEITIYDALDQQQAYSKVLAIHNANSKHNGYYQCSFTNSRPTEIQIFVQTKCKKFDENDEFDIDYDRQQEVNSSVMFACKDPNKKLDGFRVLTCLATGQWSGTQPKCVANGCPKLEESDDLSISYSQEQAVGSTATFHCFEPRKINGNSHIRCLLNREWSGTVPSCTLPRCPLQELFQHVPENVVPRMDDVTSETLPYGFELQLMCEGDLRLMGSKNAKCAADGLWDVPKVSCMSGCGPLHLPEGTTLVIEPIKEFYRFGEFLSLSCDPGHVLSEEVEVMMCLKNGWSESAIPHCVDPPPKIN